MDSYQKLIYTIISDNPGISIFDVKEKSGFEGEALKDTLSFLIKKRYIFSMQNNRYYLADEKITSISERNQKSKFAIVLSVIIFTLSFLAITQNTHAYTPKAPNIKGAVLNAKLSGYKYIDLNKINTNVIIVNFWATWCPPCRAEIPMLNRFYKNNRKNVTVIGVNVNVTKNGVRNFTEQFGGGIAYPIIHANMLDIENYGGLGEVPQSFFIMNHRIVFHWTGELTANLLNAVTQKMLSLEKK
ncbi:MAG: TlpA family protein disulfide reductase [bacterium]